MKVPEAMERAIKDIPIGLPCLWLKTQVVPPIAFIVSELNPRIPLLSRIPHIHSFQIGKIFMKHMQGWLSGSVIPKYAANIEGGGGKVMLKRLRTTNRSNLPGLEKLKKAQLLGYRMKRGAMPLTNPAEISLRLDELYRKSKL
jgi:hypothetical protein